MEETNLSRAGSILVVDDDPVVRSLMRATLENDNFEVIEAADGVEGCRLYEERRPDLLLVDVIMPRMDGFELCRRARALPGYQKTPVIYVTIHSDFESQAKSALSGADDLITKPVFGMELAVKAVTLLLKSRVPA